MYLLIFWCIKQFQFFGNIRKTDIGIKIYFHFTLLSVFRCNDNHTISCHWTVDSRCCTIFQNLHWFYINRIYVVNITGKSIYNIKWFIVSKRFYTTNLNRNPCSGITSGFQYVYTRNFALQCFCRVSSRAFCQFIHIYRWNRSGHVAFLHRTITYHNNLVQHFRIFFQGYFKYGLIVYRNFLSLETYIRNLQSSVGRYRQFKVTVDVCNHTVGSSFF